MNQLFLFAIAVAFCTGSIAQIKDTQDPKAKGILDEVSAKTKSYTSIKVDFTMVMQSKDKTKKPETQKGALQLKGDRYKLDIKGQEIISDAKTSWTYLKDNNELQINSVDPNSNDGVTPSNIFTIYEKGYKYKFISETATTQTIDLFPNNPEKKKFHTIKLVINKAQKQISSFTVFMKDGNVFDYTINTFVTSTVIPDSVFVFDVKAHPGIEVVDLRE
ncbi:MAG: outer membrane lipoprotein carrier protein LolA [Bacteroidia bacterium]|nr:outer membrane lipoprotein carrier protein LolA [Bacteroidia bacterium]